MNTPEKTTIDLAKTNNYKRPYSFTKGFAVALVPVLALIFLCAAIFGAPQSRELSLQDWAQSAPTDFVQTASEILAGRGSHGSYGPPYNLLSQGESLGPIRLQKLGGLGIPIDPVQQFVIRPLEAKSHDDLYAVIGAYRGLSATAQTDAFIGFVNSQTANLSVALGKWADASTTQQIAWAKKYIAALESAGNRQKVLTDPAFGPVKTLTDELLYWAQSGTLDGILTTQYGPYPSDFTEPALFLGDGKFIRDQTRAEYLDSKHMALSSGTHSYPGQFWLIPYSSWYSIKPFSSSKNADIEVFAIVLLICLGTIYLPKIPILNALPRMLPFHRALARRQD